jgi:hypothetical protein
MVAIRRQSGKNGIARNAIIFVSLTAISFLVLEKNTSIDLENIYTVSTKPIIKAASSSTTRTFQNVSTVSVVIDDAPKKTNHKSQREKVNRRTPTTIRQLQIQEFQSPKNREPLLLKGWEEYQIHDHFSSIMQLQNFKAAFGNFTHYVKNQLVQPLKDDQGRKCLATASGIVDLMASSSKEKKEECLLFFTNNVEAPDFFKVLQEKYMTPPPIDFGQKGFQVFSAMAADCFHGFHKHDDAQIYQIHGHKMWWLLPPEAPSPGHENSCSYLKENSKLPAQSRSILQQPGDTIFVPKGWWHATCALDGWTVAIGQQKGSPSRLQQFFERLPGKGANIDETINPMPWTSGNAFRKRMVECGVNFD